MNPHQALRYARNHRARFIEELKQFLTFPSVSSQPEHLRDIRRCAAWFVQHLQHIGLENARLIETPGAPLVYASWMGASGRPTIIIYGHYDVLPGEPRIRWKTPPFSPVIRGGKLYARGAADDKGQVFCHVKAIEACLRSTGTLPVNIQCIFEGEEEVGSPHLLPFVRHSRQVLRADAAVISDTKMLGPQQPAISYAQRGGLRAEIHILGPRQELHSGTFGGAVLNPIQAACDIVAGLHRADGRIAIPGFYDDVREWSPKERDYMASVGPTDDNMLGDAGVDRPWGESGYTLYERTTIRPALTLNGIAGGHAGPGVRGVIPVSAVVKLSFRLVPDQDPERIALLFRRHIHRIAPPQVECSVRAFSPIHPVIIDRSHPAVQTARLAFRRGFGYPAVFVRSGGSIPVVNAFQDVLGIPAVLMGFGLPDDRIHAPNEKFSLRNFFHGIDTVIWYLTMAAANLRRTADPRSWTATYPEVTA